LGNGVKTGGDEEREEGEEGRGIERWDTEEKQDKGTVKD